MLANSLLQVIDSLLELLKAEGAQAREQMERFGARYILSLGLLAGSMLFLIIGLALVLLCLYYAFLPLVGGNHALATLIDAGFAFVIAGALFLFGKWKLKQ